MNKHTKEAIDRTNDGVGYACTSILSEEYKFSDDQKPFRYSVEKDR